MKKILSLVLAAVLLVGLIPHAFATSMQFTDVAPGRWYTEHIQYCYENGLMAGTSATKFNPDDTMTRAMTVTVLYRLAGEPEATGSNPFKDVPSGKWFTDAVIWAVENEITTGTSATTFAPDAKVTREQLVTFLCRYAASFDESATKDHSRTLTGYTDANRISSYAKNAFGWAVKNQIISGTDNTHLSPATSASRAQCATILSRFDRWLNNEDIGDSEPMPSVPETEPTQPEPTDPPSDHTHNFLLAGNYDPKCNEGGYTLYWCTICFEEKKEYTSNALGHDYVGVESEYWTDYTCSRCGDRYWDTDVLIDEAFEAEVAMYIEQYINQFRNEQGSPNCEHLPGMTQVAKYRSNQLIDNYGHDESDIREAHAYYEYGRYIDMTAQGYTEEYNYWTSHANEAIACGSAGGQEDLIPEVIAKRFAESLRDSAPHWAYLGDAYFTYIAAGASYEASERNDHTGSWHICVMVSPHNCDNGPDPVE